MSTTLIDDEQTRAVATGVSPVVLTNVQDIEGNPYVRLWSAAARRAGVRLVPLSKSAVLRPGRERPSWVHLQWPEWAMAGDNPATATVNVAKFLTLVAVARARGARVMVTAHNVWSHDRRYPRVETLLWALLGRLTTDLHVLSEAGLQEFLLQHPSFRRAAVTEIPHGNYDPEVGGAPERGDARDELGLSRHARIFVTFGALKRYKGVEDVAQAFMAVDDDDARLVVAGRVGDEALMQELEEAARRDGRIRLMPEFLSDERMLTLVRAADAVVLPYRRVLNSGSALLALTLGRPVLLPRTPTFRDLRDRVGDCWVSLFDGQLGSADLTAMPSELPPTGPDLSWCNWDVVTSRLRQLWAL